MNIVMIGAGAMGSLLHQQLDAYHQVHFLPKPGQQEFGFTETYQFTHLNGNTEQLVRRYIKVEQIGQADMVICALKAYQVKGAVEYIAPFLSPDCPLVLQHNGMGVFQQVRQALGDNYKLGLLLSTQGARRVEDEQVLHTGKGNWQLGSYQAFDVRDNPAAALLNHLQDCSWYPSIREIQWTKLAVNCVINPLTAIYDVLNGELNNDRFTDIIDALINEVVVQAKVEKINLEPERLRNTIYQVIRQTAGNSSSMREDILAHRQSEIEFINGYIVNCAQHSGRAAPQNQWCVTQINQLQKK
ncbi:ketopantoate reductase family protein [Thalassotalea mangrovi]|uniref:2-dehydropantoate 2-reductase n=1 Tax=Thalassotalea mangrovi TaxID=2572245 RepID=A0A4U1B9N4_9GAMM|nr:2-dehydropantoate 2-reductase [Thalassotalea mangrovi]TKB47421.1 2-dehydropantoate 2-reductase [Thalassotalea mangrovi]